MQVLLTGFLEGKTPTFMNALWALLLSAQSNPLRVPAELLEEKKKELREREAAEAIKRRGQEAGKGSAAALDDIRARERGERDDRMGGQQRDNGYGGGRGGRDGGDFGGKAVR